MCIYLEAFAMPPMKSPSKHIHDHDEENYTLTHLAHRWGVSRREIRRLLQEGKLPFVQILGQLRVPVEAVRRYEQSGH